MPRQKPVKRPATSPGGFEQARDELFSHILRCGVLEASTEHQKDWFDDTMDYLAERYDTLADRELAEVRRLGEQYCRPVLRKDDAIATAAN